MTDRQLLEGFQIHLVENPLPSRVRGGASDNTIRGYVQDISIFLRWWKQMKGGELTAASLQTDPFQMHRKVLNDFLSWLQTSKKYRASTVLRYAASLRAFCGYLIHLGLIDHNPTMGLSLPERETPEPKGLTDDQRSRFEAVFLTPWINKTTKRPRVKAIQENVQAEAKLRLIRDKAIAYLMLYAGLRVEEVERLDLEAVTVRTHTGSVLIRKGKGFRERTVPLPKPALEPLKPWLIEREKLEISHDALFVNTRRPPYKPLSKRSMQAMISEAGQRAGLDRRDPPVKLTPHVLRHTAAFMLRQVGVSVEIRAKFLGHSIQTAMRYGSPKADELQAAARALDEVATR
jgi:site-specific recombinase XerD